MSIRTLRSHDENVYIYAPTNIGDAASRVLVDSNARALAARGARTGGTRREHPHRITKNPCDLKLLRLRGVVGRVHEPHAALAEHAQNPESADGPARWELARGLGATGR